jgi:hypothetical protein
MIDIKSDLDYLAQLAADFQSDGHAKTAADFRRAVMDIQNLRDYAAQLEKSIHQLSDTVLVAEMRTYHPDEFAQTEGTA